MRHSERVKQNFKLAVAVLGRRQNGHFSRSRGSFLSLLAPARRPVALVTWPQMAYGCHDDDDDAMSRAVSPPAR